MNPAGPDRAGDALVAEVRRAGFAALLQGRSASAAELAAAAGAEEGAVAEVIATLVEAGRATVTSDGRVDGIGGLSLRPGRHVILRQHILGQHILGRLAVRPGAVHPGGDGAAGHRRRLHTWCAFDAVAIPAALGWTARAVTTCGACGAGLAVTLVGGAPAGPAWGWLPPGDCEHVLRDFCSAADLFCDRAHLDAWRAAAGDPPGEARPVTALAALGRKAWADCLPARAPRPAPDPST